MPRVVHFELAADDPARATKFYQTVFGWKVEKWGEGDYWLANTGPEKEMGINGAIMPRKNALAPVINTIGVSSLDDFRKKVEKAGGKNITPRTTIPSIGYFCYCQDTEGNIFGILQPDMAAR